MKTFIRQILALLIALFVLFGAGGCDGKRAYHGVREGTTVRCAALENRVYTCIGSDGAIYTCVLTGSGFGDSRMDCAEQKGPAPAEAR